MKITVNQLRQIIREEIRKVSIKEETKWPGKNSLTDKAANDIEKALQPIFDGEGNTSILANTGGVEFRIPGSKYFICTTRSTKKEGAYDVYMTKGESINPIAGTLKTVGTPDDAIKAAVQLAKKFKQ